MTGDPAQCLAKLLDLLVISFEGKTARGSPRTAFRLHARRHLIVSCDGSLESEWCNEDADDRYESEPSWHGCGDSFIEPDLPKAAGESCSRIRSFQPLEDRVVNRSRKAHAAIDEIAGRVNGDDKALIGFGIQ